MSAITTLRSKPLGIRDRAVALLVAIVGAASLRLDKRSQQSSFRWEPF
jgi:hypothetical protein